MAAPGHIGGGPKGAEGFPDYDAKHARLAISGATRSEHAGNISASTAAHIKAKARAKLKSFHGHEIRAFGSRAHGEYNAHGMQHEHAVSHDE